MVSRSLPRVTLNSETKNKQANKQTRFFKHALWSGRAGVEERNTDYVSYWYVCTYIHTYICTCISNSPNLTRQSYPLPQPKNSSRATLNESRGSSLNSFLQLLVGCIKRGPHTWLQYSKHGGLPWPCREREGCWRRIEQNYRYARPRITYDSLNMLRTPPYSTYKSILIWNLNFLRRHMCVCTYLRRTVFDGYYWNSKNMLSVQVFSRYILVFIDIFEMRLVVGNNQVITERAKRA